MAAFLTFLWQQLFATIPVPEEKHTGQTMIVTGANVGLGFEAARHLTRLDAKKVILACRNIEKGEAAKKSIEETTQRRGVVEVWQVDLSSYESVKQFARRVEDLERLDAIIENAAIATQKYQVFEGNESTLTVNVISTFLMALLVLPKLRETSSKFNVTPMLSIVNSEVHGFVNFPEMDSQDIFEKLNDKGTANMNERYPMSKLVGILYGRELAARTEKNNNSAVIINFPNPGLCHSELAREGLISLKIMKFFLARSTECGSRTLVNATEAGPASHGQYLSACRISPPSPFVRSEEGAKAQAKVWAELSKKLEIIQPGIMSNV